MATNVKDWNVVYFDMDDNPIDELLILNKTEFEARKVALSNVPTECTEWDLKPKE